MLSDIHARQSRLLVLNMRRNPWRVRDGIGSTLLVLEVLLKKWCENADIKPYVEALLWYVQPGYTDAKLVYKEEGFKKFREMVLWKKQSFNYIRHREDLIEWCEDMYHFIMECFPYRQEK